MSVLYMQQLHPDILREIARRVNMRNRAALEATSRTMLASVRPATAEITRETKAALCRALKIAFQIRKVMRQFRGMPRFDWTDPQKRFAFKEALDAYVSRVKARAQPGEGAELEWNTSIYFENYIACNVQSIFVGSINNIRISVTANITPETLDFVAHTGILRIYGKRIFLRNPRKIPEMYRPSINTGMAERRRDTVARMKRKLRLARREARVRYFDEMLFDRMTRLSDKLRDVQVTQINPDTIALKVMDRAIKACATSLYATMWVTNQKTLPATSR